jgi:hypothetical protein
MILQLNPKRCPRCHRDTVSRDARRCLSCDCRLMTPEDDFAKLAEEGQRSFYVFFKTGPMRGWVHSDHLENPQPNSPEGKYKDPGKNYGKRPLPANCSAA